MFDISSSGLVSLPYGAVEFLFEGGRFAVDRTGDVYRLRKVYAENGWYNLSVIRGQDGRRKAQLTNNKKTKIVDIAKLMVEVICDERRDRTWLVDFLDDNKDNLRLDNLCWRKHLGRNGKGEKIPIEGV